MEDLLASHLELRGEIDALVERLRRVASEAPPWQPADACRALMHRLTERADALRVRLDAPLVVATLGGTGTGKSTLINALLGGEVVATGRRRPTTMRPTLICRRDITPELLGIDPASVEVIHADAPLLRDLVLIDCPDPDTSEDVEAAPAAQPRSNLARLRGIVPHCDVLLATATQQKYRDARVADELAAAAVGARIVFVQTHAAVDDDIRGDWRDALGARLGGGKIFRVDSLAALEDAKAQRQPRGDFAELVDLLTRELAGAAQVRIRRANFLDLAAETLERCRKRVEERLGDVDALRAAIESQRAALGANLAARMRADLLASRRQWEGRLLDRTASRWGLSPFALVLRLWQGLGGLLSGAMLYRARTPAQMALWGAVAGGQALGKRLRRPDAAAVADRAVSLCWTPSELRSAAIVLEGYARDAGLPRGAAGEEAVADEALAAQRQFVATAASEIDRLIDALAARHARWLPRIVYELLLIVFAGGLLFRLGKNFFFDSWLSGQGAAVHGMEFYAAAAFWLALWCLVLLWFFHGRLRRGLSREIQRLSGDWAGAASGLFRGLERQADAAVRFREDLAAIEADIAAVRARLAAG